MTSILINYFKQQLFFEIVQLGQGGLTIRTLEALFYNKKVNK